MIAQGEQLPNITGAIGGLYGEPTIITNTAAGVFGKSDKSRKSGLSSSWISDGGIDFNASRSNSIYTDNGHVTPDNTSIKIWKRTA